MHAGVFEIAAVAVIALLIFGPKQLPKLAESIRKSKEELKSEKSENS